LFCGLFLIGSVVRLLLLVYSVCTRGALRCLLIKLQLLIKKRKKKRKKKRDMGYFEGAMTSKTPIKVLGLIIIQHDLYSLGFTFI
jgi:hypothetical protein